MKINHLLNNNRNYFCYYNNCKWKYIGFKRKEHLIRHINVHKKYKPYICIFCTKHFGRIDEIKRHIKSENRRRKKKLM